ncbi:hypothetical protein FNV43_RR15509 [Rhamnella rubrinervis]|uniref:Lipid droplet-associated hydrolase n=1 Tax=Rhamnella rubrinervis TaxID=2594499 RepID=A0A8K0GWU7_9ROSA|nr:hypothetical protein FNV43_RR15509 [Rhamnella rubrinervis]
MIMRPAQFFMFSLRAANRSDCASRQMGQDVLQSKTRRQANFRLCNVSSYTTEIVEIHAGDPTFHVLLIPGNPGVVSFYKDFVESLYELLGGTVSVTAIGHISHTKKNWEHGRLFSLLEQTNHKMDFINQELQNDEVPIVLVGHSIGSYISIDLFRRIPEKVRYCIGLYPFLALNTQSKQQTMIGKIAASPIVCVVLSYMVALLGMLPTYALRLIVKQSLGKSWSATAIEATCSHLAKLSETPDWAFMRAKHHKFAFLFGIDDHWGPLEMFEEISKEVPEIGVSIEREGGHMLSVALRLAHCGLRNM